MNNMLGVHNHVMKGKRQSKRNKKEIKVTYISSPMKVKTSASNFRALVQELTGQYSNVAEMFVEVNDGVAEDVHKGACSNQQWGSSTSSEAYLPESTNWMKPDDQDHCSELDLRSSMEPLNGQLQYDFLNFDMMLDNMLY